MTIPIGRKWLLISFKYRILTIEESLYISFIPDRNQSHTKNESWKIPVEAYHVFAF